MGEHNATTCVRREKVRGRWGEYNATICVRRERR